MQYTVLLYVILKPPYFPRPTQTQEIQSYTIRDLLGCLPFYRLQQTHIDMKLVDQN